MYDYKVKLLNTSLVQAIPIGFKVNITENVIKNIKVKQQF